MITKTSTLVVIIYWIAVLTLSIECLSKQSFIKEKYQEHPDVSLSLATYPDDRVSRTLEATTRTPVVFWHGMGDTAFGSINIDRQALQKKFPGLPVFSIQIGNNSVEDAFGGYFVNVNKQIDMACEAILKNDIIKKKGAFHGVGFSQGGQFLRGLIQRCPFRENGIKPRNIITLGGQHQGVFGLPNCFAMTFCEHIRFLLSHAAYHKSVQDHIVQAEYWHDPKREEEYKSKSAFMADINNENQINQTYVTNLLSLDNLVLVQFMQDDMVIPRESSLFGYYAPEQDKEVTPLEASRLYIEDRLGLKAMAERGTLKQIKIPGLHLQYKMSWFLDNIGSVYLAN